MAKQEAEWSNRLSTRFLKKHGYLKDGWRSGGIKWTHGWSENESAISFTVSIDRDYDDHIRLQYTYTSNWTGEKDNMNYKVKLTTTPCNYGGKRYWFICPLSKDGHYCGRRVGVLFSIGKWFGCRHCGDICYSAQLEGGNLRVGAVTEPVVEQAYGEIKRFYYNGKATRKYKRYLRLQEKMDKSWAKVAIKLGIKDLDDI